jgi:DNA-binding NarL/FixJ family response regulator
LSLFGDAAVGEAGSFDHVVALLDRDGEVDLVLLDLTMPGVHGSSGLMYPRAQYPNVPVVVVSANDEPVVIRRCIEFGASGFIPKTLGVEEMRAHAGGRDLRAQGIEFLEKVRQAP